MRPSPAYGRHPACLIGFAFLGLIACSAETEGAGEAAAAASEVQRPYAQGATCALAPGESARDLSALTGLAVGPSSAPLVGPVLRPFVSDGCSVAMDGVPGSQAKAWQACCVAHDISYWLGGTSQEKEAADAALRQCLQGAGYPALGEIYRVAVRAFGGPDSDQSYRWGFGWNAKRPYGPVTDGERAQVERLYGVRDPNALQRHLLASSDPLVEPCDTYDPAFNGLAAEERIAYDHLRATLGRDDVITSARWTYFNRAEKTLSIQLERCAKPMTFTFSRQGALLASETCAATDRAR